MNRAWLLVILAGILEVLWAMGLKYADDLLTWAGTFFLIYLSFLILMKAIKLVPVATAYAVFTGIGTAGTVVIDMFVFGEPFSWLKVAFIMLLLVGVLGLKLVTASKEEGEA